MSAKRLTPQERLDRDAQKLAGMGITVSITRNAAGIPSPVMDELEAALLRAGVLESKGDHAAIRSLSTTTAEEETTNE